MKSAFLLLLLAASANALASDLDFVLKNESGRSFEAIYLSAEDDNDWNANLLRKGVLADRASVAIRFAEKPGVTIWDLNLVDKAGPAVAFDNLNLLDVKSVTIKQVGGVVTAVVE